MIVDSTKTTLFEREECGVAWLQSQLDKALVFSNPLNWQLQNCYQDDSYHVGEVIKKEVWVCSGTPTNQSPKHDTQPWLIWQERLEEYKDMVGMNPHELTLKIFGYIPTTRRL